MPKLQELIDGLKSFLKEILGNNLPPWVFKIVFTLAGLFLLLKLAAWLLKLWQDEIKPRIHNPEQKKRVSRRQRYAGHIASEIERLNRREDWDDYHFAELEAEVEAEARRNIFSLIPFRMRTRTGLRREKSLSKAIKDSADPIIQLEGDPGSGKSVALRHLTITLAKKASKSRSLKSVIPIYINLKELKRDRDQKIDRNLIESFVLETLKRANDRNIEEFLDKEFSLGLEEGTWFFLFDSFDEIPEVLSSTEEDRVIKSYADAISDFLSAFNRCRGVVASRRYRSPGKSQWAQFRIMPLTETRRDELINRADLDLAIERDLKGQLGMANPEIRDLAKNPMLLGLLCIHMKTGNPFPQNAHSVLATYLDNRLSRDRDRLKQRFNLETEEIRIAAEKVAFCMAADHGLGLTPSRESLLKSLEKLGLQIRDTTRLNAQLDGLEYIKLARSEGEGVAGNSQLFTFAHRRFQEYYATCVVLREPDRVTARELLTDARWRETAVVMCQTQAFEKLVPLLDEARKMLREMVESIPSEIKYTSQEFEALITAKAEEKEQVEDAVEDAVEDEKPLAMNFPWPSGAIHLLGLLQDGFSRKIGDLPNDIRRDAGTILLSAGDSGSPFDEKWVLEVAGVSLDPILLKLLRDGFYSGRKMLRDLAYSQVARLNEIPNDIAWAIRRALVNMTLDGRLRRDYHATRVYLTRIDKSDVFLSVLLLLRWLSKLSFLLQVLAIGALVAADLGSHHSTRSSAARYFILCIIFGLIILPQWQLRPGLTRRSVNNVVSTSLFYIPFAYPILYFIYQREDKLFYVALPLALSAYMIAWAYSSILAAWRGRYVQPISLPFMPIVGARLILSDIRKLRPDPQKSKALLEFVVFGLMLLAYAKAIKILSGGSLTLYKAALCIIYPLIAFFSLPTSVLCFLWCSDFMRWHRRPHLPNDITGQDLLDLLCRFRSGRYRLKAIKEVRAQEILVFNRECDRLIESMAFAMKRKQLMKSNLHDMDKWFQLSRELIKTQKEFWGVFKLLKSKDRVLIEVIDRDNWYEESFGKYRTIGSNREEDILDELCLLAEQSRDSRRA